MELFESSRNEVVLNADWRPQTVRYIETWKYKNIGKLPRNYRHGSLEDSQIKDWLRYEGEFSIPEPPAEAGELDGSIRLLFCERPSHQKVSVGISRENFELVESDFDLHHATLPSLSVAGGSYSKHIQYSPEDDLRMDKISIILKTPQKLEIANSMLSLTYDFKSHNTTAIIVGEFITKRFWDESKASLGLTPFEIILKWIQESVSLWNHPFLLPCLVLKDHLSRTRKFCDGPLTHKVMHIEDQLGTTRVGRRNDSSMHPRVESLVHLLAEERFNRGEPVEKSQALNLTIEINTQFTKVLFTKQSPKWNHEASQFLLQLIQDIPNETHSISQERSLSELLEYNIPIAKAAESHVFGLQTRLELQLNVLYSFIAQTDNQLSARLAATSGRDSTSMKILAFITTLYLPGTFIATLFSMSMFDWQHDASNESGSTVSHRFWIYWAVSAPLTALTFFGFGMWWRVEQRRFDINVNERTRVKT